MPCVHIYQNKKSKDLVLCSFVPCAELGGGYSPTGPLVNIPLDEFAQRGTELVTEEFELFYTRGPRVRSELFEEMTKAQQKKFLSEHYKVIISKPFKDKPSVNIFVGPNNERYGRLEFPFDKEAFPSYVLEALSTAG